MKRLSIYLAVIVIWTACSPSNSGRDPKLAEQALVEFFSYLHSRQYDRAEALYGGEYQILSDYNPQIDPNNHVALLQAGCQINGFQCLPIRSVELKEQSGDKVVFSVEFNHPDGSLFVLGPCCGADETEMPPVSQFEYHVQKTPGGKFLVLDLPVYVP